LLLIIAAVFAAVDTVGAKPSNVKRYLRERRLVQEAANAAIACKE
jgi:hypothetical protein